MVPARSPDARIGGSEEGYGGNAHSRGEVGDAGIVSEESCASLKNGRQVGKRHIRCEDGCSLHSSKGVTNRIPIGRPGDQKDGGMIYLGRPIGDPGKTLRGPTFGRTAAAGMEREHGVAQRKVMGSPEPLCEGPI